jgi:hypothetical protein
MSDKPDIKDGVRGAGRIFTTDAGVIQYVVSQSWLSTMLQCPEMARVDLVNPSRYRLMGDSAAIGIAVHEGLDEAGKWWASEPDLQNLSGFDLEAELFEDAWNEVVDKAIDRVLVKEAENMVHHNTIWQTSGPDTFNPELAKISAKGWLEQGLRRMGDLIQGMDPAAVQFEQTGLERFLVGDGWELWLHGTCDLLLTHPGEGRKKATTIAHDWKTGKPYAKWECERTKVQHLVYSFLFGAKKFYYQYLSDTTAKGTVMVDIRGRDMDRLQIVCESAVDLLQALPPEEYNWTVNPTGWWCSEKWCGRHALGECVGETRVIFPDFKKERR